MRSGHGTAIFRGALEVEFAEADGYWGPLFIATGDRDYPYSDRSDFHNWIETLDGVIIDPTAGQFKAGAQPLAIVMPGHADYPLYHPSELLIFRTTNRPHPRG